jgi:hypothetical protein
VRDEENEEMRKESVGSGRSTRKEIYIPHYYCLCSCLFLEDETGAYIVLAWRRRSFRFLGTLQESVSFWLESFNLMVLKRALLARVFLGMGGDRVGGRGERWRESGCVLGEGGIGRKG